MKIINYFKRKIKPSIPQKGYTKNLSPTSLIEQLSDKQLKTLNELLDWNCFTVDAKGRRFGNLAWSGKRDQPMEIPDRRHLILQEKVDLSQQTVLEVGCFEGIHTISLCQLAKKVIAIDSRVENVVKTMVRCQFFDCYPKILVSDIENRKGNFSSLHADFCHHFGVLYHLKNPVAHLLSLGQQIANGIYLDTHVADATTQPIQRAVMEDISVNYSPYREGKDVFAGMYDHSKWLTLDSLKDVLLKAGFKNFELIEERNERNGLRILALVTR